MTAAGPWSVKGIEPKAREVAKDLARRSGLTLGEWLNQMIIEGEPGEAPPPYETAEYREPSPRRFSPPGEPFRTPFAGASLTGASPTGASRESETQRIVRALDQLTARIEAAEHRSTLAISGIDQSVMGVVSRLEAVERDQGAVAARFDGALEEVRQTQAKSADKVRRLAEEDAPRIEAMKALEGAVSKVAEKLYEAEGKTRVSLNALNDDVSNMSRRVDRAEVKVENQPADLLVDSVVSRIAARLEDAENRSTQAVRALETSLAGLGARLQAGETEADAAQRRFERLTVELTSKADAARADMADRLKDLADGKIERMEASLGALSGQVEQGERRSAQAIDHMGREVMRIASTMGDRVAKVEARSAAAAEQVGGEMARIADAMEQRMGRQDAAQAQALEKLGGEISRIAEKLHERIAASERRAAQSVDDVGDQLSRVTERLNQRHDRAQSDLVERMQQSEARTAKLLEAARGRLDARPDTRLGEPPRRTPPAAPMAAAPMAAATMAAATMAPTAGGETDADIFETPRDRRGHPAEAFRGADPADLAEAAAFGAAAAQTLTHDPFAEAPAPGRQREGFQGDTFQDEGFGPEAFEPEGFGRDEFARPDFAGQAFGQEPAGARGFGLTEAPFGTVAAPAFDVDAPAPSSTRAMLDQARSAARQASEKPDSRRRGRDPAPIAPMATGAVDAPPFEGEARPFSFGAKKKKKEGVTLRTALVASSTAAALAVTGAGAVLLVSAEMGGGADRSGAHFGVAPTAVAQNDTPPPPTAAPPAPLDAGGTATAEASPAPAQMAVAVTPPVGQVEGLKAPPAHPRAAFSSTPGSAALGSATSGSAARVSAAPVPAAAAAVHTVGPAASGAGEAAPKLAASVIYSAAVRKIESSDLSGVDDLRKAANLGYPAAQFYLAKLYETGGAGLKKDLIEARRWTERAAGGGDIAAMHNLGLYYYEGEAGSQDSAKAALWFRKAADRGVKDSQYNLALLYAKGLGVPQNPAEAYKWYLIAAASGDDGAKTAAQSIRAQLTPEVQAAAERSAAAFHALALGVTRTASAAAAPTP